MNTARESFVAALEKAKEVVPNHNPALRREGPNKQLAALIRISPGRVGDFLEPTFHLPVGTDGAAEKASGFFPATRLRKSVAGFAASVERALRWLQTLELPELLPPGHEVEAIVEGYWPFNREGLVEHFSRDRLRAAIKEGRATAAKETENLSKIRVTLWIPAWGGWEKWDKDPQTGARDPRTAYLSSYGKALLRAIDPADAEINQESKRYSETFQLPIRSKESGLVLSMGLFDELSRRFRGFNFVTFPVLRFPPIGLVAWARGSEPIEGAKDPRLSDLLQKDYPALRCVVEHDVGASLLRSMFFEDPDESRVEVLSDSNLRDIPYLLMDRLQKHDRVAFIADGSFSFEVFCALREKGYHVDVHAQGLEPVFAYTNGVMFRQEDRDLAPLLNSAQHHLFRTPWRVVELLQIYINAMSEWIRSLHPTPETLKQWPKDAPIFLVSATEMELYMRTQVRAPEGLTRGAVQDLRALGLGETVQDDPEFSFLKASLFRLEPEDENSKSTEARS